MLNHIIIRVAVIKAMISAMLSEFSGKCVLLEITLPRGRNGALFCQA